MASAAAAAAAAAAVRTDSHTSASGWGKKTQCDTKNQRRNIRATFVQVY